MREFRDEHHAGSPFLSVIPALAADGGLAAALADGLRSSDAVVAEHAFPSALIAGLQAEAARIHATGGFTAARIGRERKAEHALRGDELCWLDACADVAAPRPSAAAALLAELEALRTALDRALLLGARSVEAHYARYGAGTHYARHLDRLRDAAPGEGDARGARMLSLVLYLNAGWTAADGGALRLYDAADRPHDLLPLGGRLVAFLSDRVAHEVLPAARPRWSVAAWFRGAA
jgi:SM-20-related protein